MVSVHQRSLRLYQGRLVQRVLSSPREFNAQDRVIGNA
jgi:hypothetical protein